MSIVSDGASDKSGMIAVEVEAVGVAPAGLSVAGAEAGAGEAGAERSILCWMIKLLLV